MSPSPTNTKRVVAVCVAVIAAALAIPFGVKAATNLVVIKDSNSSEKARVENGRLIVGDPDGRLSVNARSRPTGSGLVSDEDGDQNNKFQNEFGVLNGVVLDAGAASSPVTVKVQLRDTQCPGCSKELLWQGTVPAGGHVGDFFPIGLNFTSTDVVDIDFNPNSGSGATLLLYWELFPSNF